MEKLNCFCFKDKTCSLEIIIQEIVDAEFGLYVWPSAPVLAQYIFHHRVKVKGKQILELGAGTALAGIVAAKLDANVTLSDAKHIHKCLENCRKSVDLNGLTKSVRIMGITWGEIDDTLKNMPKVDIVLGSDCFYDTKDFEDIIVTVAFIIFNNPKAQFWTTYQERSDRCIDHLLLKWGLTGEEIHLETFGANTPTIAQSNLPGSHSIRMFVIRSANAEPD